MISVFVEIIGIIAGTLGVFAWIPQVKEVWVRKKHEGISLPTLHLICTALILWLIYGFMIQSVAIIISNLAALSCILALVYGVIKLREEEN
jgi:MtN3 and saliva related transmembrane protein